uniref:Ig-like domain-containing protein n=1 Tax=Globodera rostochiensis TaxID=31243 RepID=A0A914H185_GLORO
MGYFVATQFVMGYFVATQFVMGVISLRRNLSWVISLQRNLSWGISLRRNLSWVISLRRNLSWGLCRCDATINSSKLPSPYPKPLYLINQLKLHTPHPEPLYLVNKLFKTAIPVPQTVLISLKIDVDTCFCCCGAVFRREKAKSSTLPIMSIPTIAFQHFSLIFFSSKCHKSLTLTPSSSSPMPLPVLLLLLLNFARLPLPVALSSTPSPLPSQFQQQIRICPLKCQCSQDGSSLACSNLSRAEVRHLFASGTVFIVSNISQLLFSFAGGTPSSQQFASGLLNLSIVQSQLDLDILPPMERLLWLNLRGNQLDKLETMAKGISSPDRRNPSHLMPAFPALLFLDLSQNLITSISRNAFGAFPNAEEIRLSSNRIVGVEWEAFRLFRLRRLFLDNNYLLTISEHILRYSPAIEEFDLSHNKLSAAQSSSFFAAQRLRFLNLSHNRLQKFDYDSFSPFFQLESLDLSWNNFSAIPPDIRQFVALRVLNFSGNAIEKVAEGELSQPMLQTLQICDCPRLRLVERRAFAALPNLQFLQMANNPRLQFVSPGAFQNNSLLFEVDFSNNSLAVLSHRLLQQPVRLHLRSNPFLCGCIAPWLFNVSSKLVDLHEAICIRLLSDGQQQQISLAKTVKNGQNIRQKLGECPREPIVPMGRELRAKVGDFFSLYCASRSDAFGRAEVRWTLPNGTDLIGEEEGADGTKNSGKNGDRMNASSGDLIGAPSFSQSPKAPPFTGQPELQRRGMNSPVSMLTTSAVDSPFLGGLHPSLLQLQEHFQRRRPLVPATSGEAQMPQPKSRIQINGEHIRFEVLISEDTGNYICHVNGAEVVLRLDVEKPVIQLSAIEVGSHYVALVWNDSLKVYPQTFQISQSLPLFLIRAVERVQLCLQVRDAVSQQLGRVIQLSLHNPWHSYNVVRLRPLTNYTFCLVYRLVSFVPHSVGRFSSVFESCVDVQTEEQLGFWTSLSPTTIGVLLAFCFCLAALLCFRAIYLRFYIWHETKLRARMNQSMSGQSFLSHSTSLHHSVHQQLDAHAHSLGRAMFAGPMSSIGGPKQEKSEKKAEGEDTFAGREKGRQRPRGRGRKPWNGRKHRSLLNEGRKDLPRGQNCARFFSGAPPAMRNYFVFE